MVIIFRGVKYFCKLLYLPSEKTKTQSLSLIRFFPSLGIYLKLIYRHGSHDNIMTVSYSYLVPATAYGSLVDQTCWFFSKTNTLMTLPYWDSTTITLVQHIYSQIHTSHGGTLTTISNWIWRKIKSKDPVIYTSNTSHHGQTSMHGQSVEQVSSLKYLGLIIDNSLVSKNTSPPSTNAPSEVLH